MACNMHEPCKFPSPDSSQKKFPWTDKGADLAPHPVVGLVDVEKISQALSFEGLDFFFFFFFFQSASRVHVSQP